MARGDPESALKGYTRAVQITERLASADPDNTDYQNNLALFLSKAADVRRDRGDHQAALQAHTRALEIRERLATADPNNTLYQRNLTISLEQAW